MGVTLTEAGAEGECNVTPAQAAKLNNLDLKISALKALIDAVEAKLDSPDNFKADVSALATAAALAVVYTEIAAIEVKLDNPDNFKADVSALATAAALAVVYTEIAAIEAKLDNPNNFKANVSAIPTNPTLQTVWTDAKAAFIDEAISAAKTLTAAERTAIQAKILSDATPFNGGDIPLIKAQTEKQPNVVHWLPAIWGGFEDELLLKAAANPAALDVATRRTPTLPTGATVWKAYLLFKFRELYCTAANFVATAGVVQVQKVAGGAWVSGITIPTGTLDVAAGSSAAGDVLIGNVDVAAQIASGSQVEFQVITIRSSVDDLAIRDIELGLLIGYTV